MRRIRLPSPAMAVALVALLVGLTGSALAAGSIVPLAKRALNADNAKHAVTADTAKKLGTAASSAMVAQAVQQSSQAPGPASTAAGLVTVKTAPWSLGPGGQSDFTVACDTGQKAIAGGWEDPAGWGHSWDSRPTADGTGWRTFVTVTSQAPGAQTGTLYAVCLK